MGIIDLGLVPTLAEPERAAKVVAGAGAGRVLLFGSVLRGEAHHHSDIDLMVIFEILIMPCGRISLRNWRGWRGPRWVVLWMFI